MRALLPVLLGLLTLANGAFSANYQVKPDGTGDFPTIQAAIDAAAPADTVTLSNGVFRGEGNRALSISGKSILLRSASGLADSCVIDCEQASGAMTLNGVDSTCVIRGLALHRAYRWGGFGGAVTIGADAAPRFESCILADNRADGSWWEDAYGYGGAVYSSGAPVFTSCRLVGNSAYSKGGGVYAASGSLTLVGCVLSGSYSRDNGGGVYAAFAQVITSGCTFSGNSLEGGYGYPPYGKQVFVEQGSLDAYNSVFWRGGLPRIGCGGGVPVQLQCCNVWDIVGNSWDGCIAGQLGQNGNIQTDPMFCDPGAGDFRISFCISVCPCQQPVLRADWGSAGGLLQRCAPCRVRRHWGLSHHSGRNRRCGARRHGAPRGWGLHRKRQPRSRFRRERVGRSVGQRKPFGMRH